MIQSEKYTCRTKHIDIKFHSTKQLTETGNLNMDLCPSKFMTTDILNISVAIHELKILIKLKLTTASLLRD